MIDTHAHIAMDGFEGGTAGVLVRAAAAGIHHVICVGAGADLAEAEGAVAVAQRFSGTSAICGIHPHEAQHVDAALWAAIEQLCAAPEVVAVGETGLDFHYNSSPPADQERVFREHIRLARRLGKPLCIHTRNAEPDTLRIFHEENAREVGGVIHCFSGTRDFALQAVGLGFYVSIPGIVTFKKPGELIETVQAVPLDRLLIETDSPFLAPMPHRGKRNEPMFVAETLKKVAEIRGISLEDASAATTANAQRLFGARLLVRLGETAARATSALPAL